MKEIFVQYGKIIIVIVVSIAAILAVFSQKFNPDSDKSGILGAAGDSFEGVDNLLSNSERKDYISVKNNQLRPAPVIKSEINKILYANESIYISDIVSATDCDGHSIPVKNGDSEGNIIHPLYILKIYKCSDISDTKNVEELNLRDLINLDKTIITFPTQGMYKLRVMAYDKENVTAVKNIYVGVDGERII